MLCFWKIGANFVLAPYYVLRAIGAKNALAPCYWLLWSGQVVLKRF